MDNFDLRKYLTEGKLYEATSPSLSDEQFKAVAQKIADGFTAKDKELDLKYTITPGSLENDTPRGGGFDFDVEAGPNTPGPDWKDKKGFGIENYIGQQAGGSFYIKDGVVYNAAAGNTPVAKVSPEGEVEMIMEETTKSTKMKKSELKEMIRQAYLTEQDKKKDKEEEDVDAEEVDAEEVDVENPAEEPDMETAPELTGDAKSISDNLEAAIEAAREMGDEKLVNQIGNTITYFTRAHVVRKDNEVAETLEEVDVDDDRYDDVSERIDMLREAQSQIEGAIYNISQALRGTSHEAHADSYIIGHLNNWIDSPGYDYGIQQYIDELEKGEF